MSKDPAIYCRDILERIDRIERYIQGGREVYLADTMIQDAVARNFEIIGEIVKRMEASLKSSRQR